MPSGKKLLVPGVSPVTLEDAYIHERIDLNYEPNNTLITNQLKAATSMAENFTRRAFCTQTWMYQTSNIGPVIPLPRPRLQEVIPNSIDPTSMVFTDWNDNHYPIDDDTWFIDTIPQPGLLIFKAGASPFPYFFGGWWGWGGPVGYLNIKFKAGWSDDGTDVPWEVKEGILQIFGHLYENREGQPLILGSVAYDLLRPFQVDYL